MTIDLILGTAGHIDHGKTSLIRALTGTDTDRLPEEKKRGITIELGFAHLELGEYRLGIVDVPGHERFVRNMLAGATGMDLALLVVAADDSVKPQTREHLEILRMLDLSAGVIAITKADLVEADWIELVEEEIRELVRGTFLEEAPLVRTSASTQLGLDELRDHLEKAAAVAARLHQDRLKAPFRMAIDRTFTVAGHGTVVTGSVSSGVARLGDELMIEPGHWKVRVRGLQNHDRQEETVHCGQRAAVNLAGVHHDEIGRGQELCEAGHLEPSRLLTAEISLLDTAPRPLKNRKRLRVHVGTAELLASVSLLDREELSPGETAVAQLFLREPAVTVWSQPLVLRSESPVMTIGGGRVLDPDAERLRRVDAEQLEMLDRLRSQDVIARASAALYFAGWRAWKPQDLPRTAGVGAYQDAFAALVQRGDVRTFEISHSRTIWIHERIFERLMALVEDVLGRLHDAHPLRSVLDKRWLAQRFEYLPDPAVLHQALQTLQVAGKVKVKPQGVSLVGRGPKLSQNEQKLLQRLIDDYHGAGFEVPTVKQYQSSVTRNQDSVPQLVALAAANGDLVEISSEIYLHQAVEMEARARLQAKLTDSSGLTMSEIREVLATSRKYAVPYCEYLDRIGFTTRQGDVRVLTEKAQA